MNIACVPITFYRLMRLTDNGSWPLKDCESGSSGWLSSDPQEKALCANSAIFSLCPFLAAWCQCPLARIPGPGCSSGPDYAANRKRQYVAAGWKLCIPWRKPNLTRDWPTIPRSSQGMTINFKRTDAQEASLKALLQAQQDPGSPSYHKWLTPAQFGQQFGMSAADIAKVSAWLQQEGFTVTSVSAEQQRHCFSGTSRRWKELSRRNS